MPSLNGKARFASIRPARPVTWTMPNSPRFKRSWKMPRFAWPVKLAAEPNNNKGFPDAEMAFSAGPAGVGVSRGRSEVLHLRDGPWPGLRPVGLGNHRG